MSRRPKEPTWPFLSILACLFVLSAAAPRAWEESIRTDDPRPVAEEALSEAETAEPVEEEAIASGNDVDDGTLHRHLANVYHKIPLNEPLPAVRPTVEKVGGLLMVVPSPRIARRAMDPTHVNLESVEKTPDVGPLELLPPFPAATESFLTEEPESFSAVESALAAEPDSSIPEDPVPVAEPDSAPVEEIVVETTDDHDMSAVPCVSVLSADQVAEMAAQCDVVRHRLDADADWTVPVSIFERLEPLSWDCDTGEWAREVAQTVSSAAAELVANSAEAKQSVAKLFVLGRDGVSIAEEMEGTESYEQMRRALTILHRRVGVWEQITKATDEEENQLESVDWRQVRTSIQQIQSVTSDGENGSAWDSFLELDLLAEIARRAAEGLSDEDRTAARCVILKLQVQDVTGAQRTFLESQDVTDFKAALRAIVSEPVDVAEWVSLLEAFERTNSPAAGEQLAIERLKLSLSTAPSHLKLAGKIEEFYLAPNVRIAVTGYLLNRMLPDREPEYQWVRDTVMGHPVQGHSTTSVQVGVALIPDSQRMRAALTVDGLVSASTSSTAGPATFFNKSDSEYAAVKELELTPKGICFQPAEVKVDNETRLREIQTEFDWIPLVGSLAQSMARSQLEMNRSAIRRETSRKVQAQAARQIDEEIDARLGELNDRLQHRLLDPLASMSLRPEVADAKTTETRMSMQLQLAGPGQLGSNTPRPWAPSDSVLSFQMHQSALNNVLRGLELDGETLTIKELRDRLADRFNRPELLEETTEHDDVSITFAAYDAARIDFEDGRIAISLGISRLRAGTRQWRDFRVRAYYRPQTSQRSASLARDGVIELIGRVRMGSQIALRGIFSKAFAKDRKLSVVPPEVAADPRLQGLVVTQLSVNDGWFGLAVGPERIQPAMAKGPASETFN